MDGSSSRGDHEDLIRLKGTYYQLYTGKAGIVIKARLALTA